MSVPVVQAFAPLIRATERHVQWAYDYLAVGDLESAIEELQDAGASHAEHGVRELRPGSSLPPTARQPHA